MGRGRVEVAEVFLGLSGDYTGIITRRPLATAIRQSRFGELSPDVQTRFSDVLKEMVNPKTSDSVWRKYLDSSLNRDVAKGVLPEDSFYVLFPDNIILSPRIVGATLDKLRRIGISDIPKLAESGETLVRSSWTPAKTIPPTLKLVEAMRDASRDLLRLQPDNFGVKPLQTEELEPFPEVKGGEYDVPGLVSFQYIKD